ncbi:MAG: hypothetical protein R2844_10475 [Caldilineales bacterium]
MQSHGTTTLHELFGDLVILRNLAPFDTRLPGLADAWQEMGLASPRTPRKHEPEYARASVWFVRQARALDLPATPVRELLFIGDTAMADGNAFRSLARAGGWPGWCFIGSENLGRPLTFTLQSDNVTLSNRWSGLGDWLRMVVDGGARLDAGTAVVIDMDKTAVAARGRNAPVMDAARVEGVERTVATLLGADYDRERFLAAYNTLNDPSFHPFTADNQDYLAYICLVLNAGLIDLDALVADVQAGRMSSFRQFIDWSDGLLGSVGDRNPVFSEKPGFSEPPSGLRQIHRDVYGLVLAGDPTPFKAFRRNEYLCTAARFGSLPADAPVAQMLAEQVCITQEVREAGLWLKARGCLLLTMSDKPDEATLPTPELAAQGYLPIHRLATAAVGESIADQLADL